MYWRIFYDGGESFSSDDGKPWEASPSGVLIIVQEGDREWAWEQGLGFFVWKDNKWFTVDRDGADDYLYCQIFNHPKVCLRGRMVSHEYWEETVLKVREWLKTR